MQLTLIAPNTPYAASLNKPVNHAFIHFRAVSHSAPYNPAIYQFAATRHTMNLITLFKQALSAHTVSPRIDLLGYELAASALMHVPKKLWLDAPVDSRIQKAMECISANVSEPVSNEKLAMAASMSINGFIRLFTSQAGISPQQYCLRKRLDAAGVMLHHSDKSIDTIAEECGFWDRNYFTKMFRKYRSITPAKFRKQQQR